jgi:transcriptional regulator with XRE-family HTH domain
MHPFGELSARRQELGAALRRLRKSAGLSGEQIAREVGISQSRVSRIELGQQGASPEVVSRWGQACKAGDTDLEQLVALAEAAATEMVSWRKAVSQGLGKLQQDSRDLEASATLVCNFQTVWVPGLLQVPEYARRVFAAGYPVPAQSDVAAAVAGRMNRQAILYDELKRFEFVMTEAALRWRVGPPSLMRAQVDRVITVSGLENVMIGILPQATESSHWHDHGFNILDGRGDAGDAVVHVETLASGLTITDPADVAVYKDAFAQLRSLAVAGDDARALLHRVMADYEDANQTGG